MNLSKSDKQRIIFSYEKFIKETVSDLKQRYNPEIESEDLFQEGIVGLLKAANDAANWQEFAVLVEPKIIAEIATAIQRDIKFWQIIKTLRQDFAAFLKTRAKLFRKLHRDPTIAELVKATGLPDFKVENLELIYKTALDYE